MKEWDDDLDDLVIIEGFEWLEDEMGSSREIWVCWTEDEGELIEWWITGDNC